MIEYRINAAVTTTQISELFIASKINRPADDLPRLEQMFHNSDTVISAWDASRLVGICRALTDFSYCCYLSDLAVDQAYQQQGIGQKMIDLLKSELGEQVSIVLLASESAMHYYPKIGFAQADNAYVIKRQS